MLNLRVGGKYANGYGAIIEIVSAPNAQCRWFRDSWGGMYHEDGAAVSFCDGGRELNLARVISEPSESQPTH